MSVNSFIPEVWSAELLASLKKTLVYGQPRIANRNYEGEISEFGDTVTINSVGRPTVSTYTPNSTTITPEQLTTAQRKLIIDQAKYFSFYVDDVDARQVRNSGGLMSEAMREAAFALGDTADQFIAGLYTGAQSANQIGTVSVTSGALAYTQINKLGTKLDEASVPKEGRWVVVPPWFTELLLEDDKTSRVDASGSSEALRNGFVNRLLGFDLLESNNVPNPTGDDFAIIAGYPGAISYAEQINKVEAFRPESAFEDAVKGLHLYGAKLVRPDGIATVLASKT